MAPRSHHAALAAALALVVAFASLGGDRATAQTQPSSAPTAPSYRLGFDNYVTTDPLPLAPSPDLDILVHSRDNATWGSLEGMSADHGAHCEAPPATHALMPTMAYEQAAFICAANPHLMTSIKAGGYGLIELTPGAMMDWSAGESVLRFDVSTLRHSQRDWWDVMVTPFDDLKAAPLEAWLPDLDGLPKRGLHVTMGGFNGQTVFRGARIDDHAETDLGSCWWCGYESVLTPSASRRDTFELRVSRTHVKFSLLSATTGQPIMTWVDADTADLGYGQGVVQIGHHSYNPEKDCDPAIPQGTVGCMAGTWHWDNISISPAAPLTIIPARERRTNPTQPTYTFPTPAGPGAMLQVNATSDSLEMSLDGGTTWAPMTAQETGKPGSTTKTYLHAVPEGTTAATLRGSGTWIGPWDANHAALYSRQAPAPAQPTPTGTVPPTNTPMPTETAIPTSTPGPTNTPEPIPTSTPTAAPVASTPMPSGQCVVTVSRGGTPVASWSCQ